jgi:hypothetical protein
MIPTSQPPSYKELWSVASSNDLDAASPVGIGRAARAYRETGAFGTTRRSTPSVPWHSQMGNAHSLTLCQPCRLAFGDRCAAYS